MFALLLLFFRWVNHVLFGRSLTGSRRAQSRPRVQHARPSVEGLTDRITPATLHWAALQPGNWSVAGNWTENQQPANGDILVFDGRENTNSTNDMANLALGGLQITAGYTKEISLSNPVTVTGDVSIAGGWLRDGSLNVTSGTSVVTWAGGTMERR